MSRDQIMFLTYRHRYYEINATRTSRNNFITYAQDRYMVNVTGME
jgi:hypothetical protein